MTAAEVASFSVVLVGFWLFLRVYRYAQTTDRWRMSPTWLKDVARKGDDDAG